MWVAALIAATILPIYSSTGPAVTNSLAVIVPPAATLPNEAPSALPSADIMTGTADVPPAIRFSPNTGVIATVAYLLLVLYGAVRFARACLKTAAIRASGEPCIPTASLGRVWSVCTGSFGLTGVQLLRSSTVSSPVALGAVRPAVIVPEYLWQEPSEELLTAAIGHELAHVARHDFLTNLFHELLLIAIAFHPAAR